MKDIGQLEGRLLVFGGVYSNLEALQALQAIAQQESIPPSNIICTGDIVGYCAEPEACLQCIRNWGIHNILGNVEIQLREGQEDCGCDFNTDSRCDIFSRQWYPFAQSQVSPDAIQWLDTLPDHLSFNYAGKKVVVVHGSYFATAEYVFKSSPWSQKANNFSASQSQIILAGHSGLPFQDEQDGLTWLNAGVIGMPANDGSTKVWYLILEETNGQIHYQHHSFAYNHELAAQKMKAKKLPTSYALTLQTGIWDNCEILPPTETALQGQAFEF